MSASSLRRNDEVVNTWTAPLACGTALRIPISPLDTDETRLLLEGDQTPALGAILLR
jgi:hypothetical protein